jgi:virginiamycin B lyase
VWSDSQARLWVSEWNTGTLSVYDPKQRQWKSWPLPGEIPRAYSIYVDDKDVVWVTDFPGNAIHRFDPKGEKFESFPSDRENANVRQMLGRPGEAWGAESGTDRLVVIRSAKATD